eukprot:scaffold25100_cov45-Attheya_sp.AAC.1
MAKTALYDPSQLLRLQPKVRLPCCNATRVLDHYSVTCKWARSITAGTMLLQSKSNSIHHPSSCDPFLRIGGR